MVSVARKWLATGKNGRFLALLLLITTLLLAAPRLNGHLQAQDDNIPATYTVQQGDTLSGIVLRYFGLRGDANTQKAKEIAALNNLPSIHSIWQGQTLKLISPSSLSLIHI